MLHDGGMGKKPGCEQFACCGHQDEVLVPTDGPSQLPQPSSHCRWISSYSASLKVCCWLWDTTLLLCALCVRSKIFKESSRMAHRSMYMYIHGAVIRWYVFWYSTSANIETSLIYAGSIMLLLEQLGILCCHILPPTLSLLVQDVLCDRNGYEVNL